MNALPVCTVCRSTNHRSHECSELSSALIDGFYSGGGGGQGGHSHDEEKCANYSNISLVEKDRTAVKEKHVEL